MIREHILVFGRVQGVGFRYRAEYTARMMNLTGYVRNLGDGSVEMEVQGEKETINLLLKQLAQSSYIHISDVQREEIPLEDGEYTFGIKSTRY